MKQVLLRPASAEDFESFYAIKADANNIKWGGFDKAPQKDTFERWYKLQLEPNSKRKIFLLQIENRIVGFSSVNFTEPNEPELSYGVLSEEAGNGYGTEILKRTTDIIGGGIFAWVSVNNSASMRCFEKAGYEQTDISEERNLALFEEPQLFYKWIMVSK